MAGSGQHRSTQSINHGSAVKMKTVFLADMIELARQYAVAMRYRRVAPC
jgi:hypothetical protein